MFLIFFFWSKKVILWDINTEANESVVQEIKARGGSVSAYTCDLSNSDDVYQTAAKVGFISQMSDMYLYKFHASQHTQYLYLS